MYFKVNDRQVFATSGGKPFDNKQPVVIFCHGSGLDHTFWGLYSRFFAFRKYSSLVPAFPGHTHSEGPCLKSVESMADWLNDCLISLEADNISVIAHSQGCLVATEFASRYPKKLRSVSLIASGYETRVNQALLDAAKNNPEDAISMMLSWGFGSVGHLHQGVIPGNSMITAGKKVMGGNIPQELFTDLTACNAYNNGKLAAGKIKAPVQLILGGKDRMAPKKTGLSFAEALPSPKLDIIDNAGHMVPLEYPSVCRNLLKEFIFLNNPSK